MQQNLDPGFSFAAPDPLAGECGRDDFRLVEDHNIARLEQSWQVSHAAIRPGDQPVFVADVRKAARELGWAPQTSADRGLSLLFDWVSSHRELFG